MKKLFMAVIALMMTISASAQFYIYCSDGYVIKVDSISMIAPPIPNVLDMDPSKCDNTTEKCWKYTLSYGDASASAYIWGTEKFVVEIIQQACDGLSGYKAILEEAPADDAESCNALN